MKKRPSVSVVHGAPVMASLYQKCYFSFVASIEEYLHTCFFTLGDHLKEARDCVFLPLAINRRYKHTKDAQKTVCSVFLRACFSTLRPLEFVFRIELCKVTPLKSCDSDPRNLMYLIQKAVPIA